MPVETAYIAASEYPAFGLPSSTTAAQVNQASRLIDTYCKRKQGFLWVADATGRPGYQAVLKPEMTYSSPNAISPGLNVAVQISTIPLTLDMLGHVLIIDRATPLKTEACVIAAVNSPTTGWVQFYQVSFAHDAAVNLEDGMTIFEERYMASERAIARVAQWPVARLLSGMGRTGYGRRSDQAMGLFSDVALIATGNVYGGPALWQPFDPTQTSINPMTGEMWIPASILLTYYTDVRLWYCAGWQFSGLPDAIKWATAQTVLTMQENAGTPMVSGMVKKVQAGDTTIEKWADKVFDAQTLSLLQPYIANLMF